MTKIFPITKYKIYVLVSISSIILSLNYGIFSKQGFVIQVYPPTQGTEPWFTWSWSTPSFEVQYIKYFYHSISLLLSINYQQNYVQNSCFNFLFFNVN